MKFEIKSRWNASILFSLETASIKLCVEAAVKSRSNLSGADLSGANLYGADLTGADLTGANLYGADLSGADLSGANLYGADLTGADLTGANLYGADLTGADLSGADLYGANLYGANLYGEKLTRSPIQIFGFIWSVFITEKHMKIGCELHTHDEWSAFNDDQIKRMEVDDALKFWTTHKSALMALCASHAKVE